MNLYKILKFAAKMIINKSLYVREEILILLFFYKRMRVVILKSKGFIFPKISSLTLFMKALGYYCYV